MSGKHNVCCLRHPDTAAPRPHPSMALARATAHGSPGILQPRSETMHAVANSASRGRRQPPEVAALQVEQDPLARGCLQAWPGQIQGTLILVDAYQAFELLRLPVGLRCAVTAARSRRAAMTYASDHSQTQQVPAPAAACNGVEHTV